MSEQKNMERIILTVSICYTTTHFFKKSLKMYRMCIIVYYILKAQCCYRKIQMRDVVSICSNDISLFLTSQLFLKGSLRPSFKHEWPVQLTGLGNLAGPHTWFNALLSLS